MEPKTTYLVTGANRGIGFGLIRALLQRPNTIVIATIRKAEPSNLENFSALPVSPGSELIIRIYSIEDPSALDHASQSLLRSLPPHITQIDALISNLGIGLDFHTSLTTTTPSILTHLTTNTLAPISLFQSFFPLLSKSRNPKFILISSSLGSIGNMEGPAPGLAYGISKAGANYFVRKMHFECETVVSVAVHPGWVRTENGQNLADSVGVERPPMEVEESVVGILRQVDLATKKNMSGSFVSYDGSEIEW